MFVDYMYTSRYMFRYQIFLNDISRFRFGSIKLDMYANYGVTNFSSFC